jgi:hypothetical protein
MGSLMQRSSTRTFSNHACHTHGCLLPFFEHVGEAVLEPGRMARETAANCVELAEALEAFAE